MIYGEEVSKWVYFRGIFVHIRVLCIGKVFTPYIDFHCIQEHAHPSGLYLKCSILLRHDPQDVRLPSVMEETLSHSELTLDLALSTIRLAAQHKR